MSSSNELNAEIIRLKDELKQLKDEKASSEVSVAFYQKECQALLIRLAACEAKAASASKGQQEGSAGAGAGSKPLTFPPPQAPQPTYMSGGAAAAGYMATIGAPITSAITTAAAPDDGGMSEEEDGAGASGGGGDVDKPKTQCPHCLKWIQVHNSTRHIGNCVAAQKREAARLAAGGKPRVSRVKMAASGGKKK